MSWCVSPWLYPVWDSLCLLDLTDYFLFHVEEIFNYNLFKKFLIHFFFSSSSETPIIQMLMPLIWSHRSLRLSLAFFILFSLCCSSKVISTILSSSLLIHSSASDMLLLIPSRVFFISVIVLFLSVCLLFNSSMSLLFLHFLHFVFKVFDHFYNHYSEFFFRLNSVQLSCSVGSDSLRPHES